MRETNSQLGWDETKMLLSLIEYDLRALPAVMFGKKSAVENVPKPLTPTNKQEVSAKKKAEEEEKLTLDGERIEPVTREELAKIFGH